MSYGYVGSNTLIPFLLLKFTELSGKVILFNVTLF